MFGQHSLFEPEITVKQAIEDKYVNEENGNENFKTGGRKQKQQACKICGKLLSSSSSYYVHMKVHSGSKPFRCTECEATFCRKTYLEELEKLAPEKGVVVNSVKEVVQQLVDDGLVDTDKIGLSTYFWSFPSKAFNTRKRKLGELTEKHENTAKKLKNSEASLESAKVGQDEWEERDKYMEKITDLRLEYDLLKMELKSLQENDPRTIEKMKGEIEELKTVANRWTDNVYNVKSWCKRKFGFEDQMLDKQFGIPSEFDYVE